MGGCTSLSLLEALNMGETQTQLRWRVLFNLSELTAQPSLVAGALLGVKDSADSGQGTAWEGNLHQAGQGSHACARVAAQHGRSCCFLVTRGSQATAAVAGGRAAVTGGRKGRTWPVG